MKSTILILLSAFALMACQPYGAELRSLGSTNDFSDIEIAEDFDGEDEDSVIDDDPIDMGGLDPISFKNTFAIGDTQFNLARGKSLRWDGCRDSKNSQGGYNSNSRCGRAFIHAKFAKQLNEHFFGCVSDAAKVAGYKQPRLVFINHLGSYNDRTARNSSRLSNHAYARALDISQFNLYDKDGKLSRVSTFLRDYKGSQAKFYDQFRACWKDSLPSQCRPGKTEYKGSVGHRSSKLGGNTLHNDHIHLSMPTCAG